MFQMAGLRSTPTLPDQRKRSRNRTEIEIDPATENVRHRFSAAAVGHLGGFYCRREAKFLRTDMRRAANANRAECDRVRLRRMGEKLSS
jgi:hypothetical protein